MIERETAIWMIVLCSILTLIVGYVIGAGMVLRDWAKDNEDWARKLQDNKESYEREIALLKAAIGIYDPTTLNREYIKDGVEKAEQIWKDDRQQLPGVNC